MKTQGLHMFIMLVILLLSACVEDDTCGENVVSGLIVSVQNSGSDSATDLDDLNQDAVSDWKLCLPNDTLPLLSMSTSFQSGIPLDLNDTSIVMVFYIKDADDGYLNDTLRFSYHQTDMKLISMACGFAPEFEIVGGAHGLSVLDSVVIESFEVSTDLIQNNVAIYY